MTFLFDKQYGNLTSKNGKQHSAFVRQLEFLSDEYHQSAAIWWHPSSLSCPSLFALASTTMQMRTIASRQVVSRQRNCLQTALFPPTKSQNCSDYRQYLIQIALGYLGCFTTYSCCSTTYLVTYCLSMARRLPSLSRLTLKKRECSCLRLEFMQILSLLQRQSNQLAMLTGKRNGYLTGSIEYNVSSEFMSPCSSVIRRKFSKTPCTSRTASMYPPKRPPKTTSSTSTPTYLTELFAKPWCLCPYRVVRKSHCGWMNSNHLVMWLTGENMCLFSGKTWASPPSVQMKKSELNLSYSRASLSRQSFENMSMLQYSSTNAGCSGSVKPGVCGMLALSLCTQGQNHMSLKLSSSLSTKTVLWGWRRFQTNSSRSLPPKMMRLESACSCSSKQERQASWLRLQVPMLPRLMSYRQVTCVQTGLLPLLPSTPNSRQTNTQNCFILLILIQIQQCEHRIINHFLLSLSPHHLSYQRPGQKEIAALRQSCFQRLALVCIKHRQAVPGLLWRKKQVLRSPAMADQQHLPKFWQELSFQHNFYNAKTSQEFQSKKDLLISNISFKFRRIFDQLPSLNE